MRSKYKSIDISEFVDADDLHKTSIKGEMRKHYREIDRKLKTGGWSAKEVVAWFNERGFPMNVDMFRVYLLALDKEHGYRRSTNQYIDSSDAIKQDPQKQCSKFSEEKSVNQQSLSPRISNPADLKKARNNEVNLDDYE